MMSKRKGKALVIEATKQPLSALLKHTSIRGVRRQLYCSDLLDKSSPLHIAVHHFDGTHRNPVPGRFVYTEAHAHSVLEVDLVIPKGRGFMLQLEIDGEVEFIRRASTVIIPAGVNHRMEIVHGQGIMICIVCFPNYPKSLIKAKKTLRKHF